MKINFFTVCDRKYPPRLQRIEYRSPLDDYADWCYYLPPENSDSRTCVVALHGFGGHGSQLYLRPSLKRFCLPEYLKRNYHILTPELRGDAWMNHAAMEDLVALLNFFRDRFGILRVILDSGSMGGFSNLVFAVRHPEQVQGLIVRGTVLNPAEYCAFCRRQSAENPFLGEILSSMEAAYGGSPANSPLPYERNNPEPRIDNLRNIPFFLAHGSLDELMPVENSRRLAALCAGFGTFHYHEIEGGNHESPLRLTSAPLDWIASFARPRD